MTRKRLDVRLLFRRGDAPKEEQEKIEIKPLPGWMTATTMLHTLPNGLRRDEAGEPQ